MRTKVGWPGRMTACFAMIFLALGALVVTGVTQPLDSLATHRLRPGDAWGPAQIRYSPWMTQLEPSRMYLVLMVTSLAVCLWRRSWWPALFGSVLASASVIATVLAKFAFRRPDPHGHLAASGGSFPSGHMIAVLVCLGGCLLMAFPRVRWWMWTPVAAAAALMTAGLLVSAAHWATDVLGGVFLALTVLAAGSRLPMRKPTSVSPRLPRRHPRS